MLNRILHVVRRADAWAKRARVRLDRALRGADAHSTHLLVAGYPRTGTSLLYNMLCSSLTGFRFDEGERPAVETLDRRGNHASKRPFDLFDLEAIRRANVFGKRIVVILNHRDVRDVVTSVYPYAPDEYLIGWEGCFRFRGDHPHYQRVFDAPGIGAFREAVRAWCAAPDLLCHALRYERLVEDPDAVQAELAERFGLSFHARFSDYHRRASRHGIRFEGRRAALAPELVKSSDPVSRDWTGRWREARHRERILAQFGSHPELFDLLRELGYEKDDAWFDELRSG